MDFDSQNRGKSGKFGPQKGISARISAERKGYFKKWGSNLLNVGYLIDLANKADEWGVSISYSAYGVLRTGDKRFFIYSKEDLETLQQEIDEIIQMKEEGRNILNSTYMLIRTYEFFRDGRIPDCKVGRRFLVVRPNGQLVPCSMRPNRLYSTQEEMLEEFSRDNKCGECYVAIRAYSDKPSTVVKDNLSSFFSDLL